MCSLKCEALLSVTWQSDEKGQTPHGTAACSILEHCGQLHSEFMNLYTYEMQSGGHLSSCQAFQKCHDQHNAMEKVF